MKSVYYFLVDNSVQWFSAISEMEGDKSIQFHHVPSRIDAAIISDICSRELHFGNKEIRGMTYSGWSISRKEFDQIVELIRLYPLHQQYLKLCQ